MCLKSGKKIYERQNGNHDSYVCRTGRTPGPGKSWLVQHHPLVGKCNATGNHTQQTTSRHIRRSSEIFPHTGTHTKKKRVHTWSETGHTQMFPCFWRSLDVITVKTNHVKYKALHHAHIIKELLCFNQSAELQTSRSKPNRFNTPSINVK